MSLSEQDLDAIGRLMDQKMQAAEARNRTRWRWFIWISIALLVASSALSWWLGEKLWAKLQDEVARINIEFSESKLAYQRALEENQQLRDERAKAEKAVHYDTTKTQADHEAGLIGDMISLFAAKDEFSKKYENADLTDPKVMEAYAQDLNKIMDKGLNPLGQIVLRNTDPAHNTQDEKMRQDSATPGGAVREPTAAPELKP